MNKGKEGVVIYFRGEHWTGLDLTRLEHYIGLDDDC